MSDLKIDGMQLAPGVIETIVSIAVSSTEGVAALGGVANGGTTGIRGLISSKPTTQGIEIVEDEAGKLNVTVHISVCSGYALPDVASSVRASVSDAVSSQVGATVGFVDVYVDAIDFAR